ERIGRSTFALSLVIEGFEGGGGRSVGTQQSMLVSTLDHVVGSKPDGDLDYIPVGTKRVVNFIAVNRQLKSVALEGLQFRVIERTYVSVLKRIANGNYAYESIERQSEISNDTRVLPEAGFALELATAKSGSFRLEVRDASGTEVSEMGYTVVGKGEASRSVERNAELELKLPKREYRAGDDVEIAITAPYTGAGLITLERDKVYAQAWFTSATTSSVQHIRIPDDFEGTGYLNVTFIRALDSREVFMSPLSYAVEPITVNREHRRMEVHLDVAAQAKPGEPLAIRYRTDRPSRIVLYAVDEGILQVTHYELPDPLEQFFRQTALMVGTSQIVDLILPEFSILRSVAAAGGDADMLAKNLNPFRRVTEKPVVFWSGIVDAGPDEHTVTYDVPDYFNGTLRVMAVAYAPSAVASTQCDSLVRSRYVITPSVPTVAAPGDVFDVGVTVNNGGADADVTLAAAASQHLEVVKAPAMPLRLAKDRETTCLFTVRVKDAVGSASLEFRASGDGEESKRRSTLSVRPAVPYRTDVRSAHFTSTRFDLPTGPALRPEFRKLVATVSALPLGLAKGLQSYLNEYPYGCSEQISSGAFCRLVLAGEVDFGLTRKDAAEQLEHTFGVLRQRQNDQGGFGYWSAVPSPGINFISVYVTQLLVEAKAAGFAPPSGMLAAALRNLTRMVNGETPTSLEEARIQAWAIYLLTREETVTTNSIINLRDTLDHNFAKVWRADLTAVYLAGALELLQQDDEARKLIGGYHCGRGCEGSFYDGLLADTQYVAILARHFPDRLRKLPADEFEKVLEPIQQGGFNTLSAAASVLALKGYSTTVAQSGVQLGISELLDGGKSQPLDASGTLLKQAKFSAAATALRFTASSTPIGAFCQTVAAGYATVPPTEPTVSGLEIYRKFPKTARVGEPINVTIYVRSMKGDVSNAAVVDLFPGGFEVVESSLQPGAGTFPGWDFVEVREDRAVFFGDVGTSVRAITYQIKATSAGKFMVPPAFVESMYDRGTNGSSASGTIEVFAR
ncbi:MAG: alpha-2-macroglobulin family protein, partial [Chthoniobacterales bacterium]